MHQKLAKTIDNTHNCFQSLAKIITERFDYIQINESNNYLKKQTIKECQEDITENKADEPLICLQRDSQVKKTNKKVKLKLYIDWVIL